MADQMAGDVVMSKSKVDTDDLSATDLLDMKSRLDDELQNLLVAHATASQESSPGDIKELAQRVSDLQEQLLEESNKHSENELLIKRIQMGKTLCDALFSEGVNSQNNPFLKNSSEILEIASQITRIHKETTDLQEKLESQKLANLKLRSENSKMMQKLQSNKEKQKEVSAEVANDKEYKSLKEKLDTKCMSVDIHKNLIQLVVLGMGTDWSQDPELEEVMLNCGEPLKLS